MLCNYCYTKEATFYLDCYCIYCESCYQNHAAPLIEVEKHRTDQNSKKTCKNCGRSTAYKLCDIRISQDENTIKQLNMNPERANLRAVETTKFHLLQNRKQIQFLEQKVGFYKSVIDFFINRYRIANFDLPVDLKKQDRYDFLNSLRKEHQAFNLDAIAVEHNLISHDLMSNKKMNLENVGFNTNNKIDTIEYVRPEIKKADDSINSNYNSRYEPRLEKSFERFKTMFKDEESKRGNNDNTGLANQNLIGFNIRNIKKSSGIGRDSSSHRNKYKLQDMLLDSSRCVTPVIRKKTFRG